MRVSGIPLLMLILGTSLHGAEVDLSSPRASAKTILTALLAKDSATIKSCMHFEGSANEELGAVFIDMLLAAQQLGDATEAKFSESGQPLARGMLNEKDIEQIEKSPIVENGGNEATLTIPGQARPMRFVRSSEGKWRWAFIDASGVSAGDLQNQISILKSAGLAMSDTAGEIADGKLQTLEEAEQALQQRLHQVLLESLRSNPPAATQPK